MATLLMVPGRRPVDGPDPVLARYWFDDAVTASEYTHDRWAAGYLTAAASPRADDRIQLVAEAGIERPGGDGDTDRK